MLDELQNIYDDENINNDLENEKENEKDILPFSTNALQNIMREDFSNTQKNLKVFCRFRPPNELELSNSTNNCLLLLSPQKLIFTQEKNLEIKKEYTFDGIFDYNSPKEDFYDKACRPIISKFIQGYNGAIICYGETGTGKTHSIREIIPLMTSQLFEYINESDNKDELFKIEVSSFEIYKEQINDLIDVNNKNLNIIQGEINNLTNIGINSLEQMNSLLNEIMSLRNIKELKLHDSKSHFIIEIKLYHYIKQKNCFLISKLFLVDLEGSERLSKNKINEDNLEEQKLINKSLIALSIIVNNLNLGNNDNCNYIPYRDSKLTQVISESFGGNCYTSLILTCSKHEISSSETRNTLMFGEKAKNIKNNPVLNVQNEFNKKNKNLFLSEIVEDENENLYESMNNMNIIEKEKKFLKIQVEHLKEIIEKDKIYMEELNERIKTLELEKKNLMNEFEKLINARKEENKKDTINSEYIESNINDLHQLLNEKEINEKNMKDKINKLELILEKNKSELSEIINIKNEEILKIKNELNNQMQTFQELIDCIEQASDQIKQKDKKIEELLTIIKNKENEENQNIKENNNIENKIETGNIDMFEGENQNLNDDFQKKDEKIKKLNDEINNLQKKKLEYDNRLSGMTKLINKMKEELEKKNNYISEKENGLENNLQENNILKNKIQSLEDNINNLNKRNKELEESKIKLKEEYNGKYNKLKKESESKVNELQSEIDIKNKISIELHNLKIKYKNILKSNEQVKLNNNKIIDNLKEEIESKTELIEKQNKENKILKNNNNSNNKEIEKLKEELNLKENLLEENKIIYENELKEVNSYKNLINKLKKENSSLNNIIIDIKAQIENQENIINNYSNKIANLEKKSESKELIINDYKGKYELIWKENILNKNRIKELEENNQMLMKNFEGIKNELNKYENEEKEVNENIENVKNEYFKEKEKYEEILRQKDNQINELNKQIINDKIGLNEIFSLQNEISQLKDENKKMALMIRRYENEKIMKNSKNEKNNKKEPIVYLINKEKDKEKIKNAYKVLTQENEQLKNNIKKLKEYYC